MTTHDQTTTRQGWMSLLARAKPARETSKATAAAPAKETASTPAAPPAAAAKRKLTYKEQRELEALPGQIEDLETEQAALEKALADGSLYASDPPLAAQKAARLMEVEEQWMAAMERLETLQAA